MMLAPVKNIAEMNHELRTLAAAAGLDYDCGPGGRLDAAIAVVAEAPGERECHLKQPLIGGSGKYLWDRLRAERLRATTFTLRTSARENSSQLRTDTTSQTNKGR